jgi:hypothetical protein
LSQVIQKKHNGTGLGLTVQAETTDMNGKLKQEKS